MKAPKPNTWYQIPRLNLAVAARKAGFDLSIYDYYSSSVRKELRRHTVFEMMNGIRDQIWNDNEFELKSFDKSVYTISLAQPLTVRYQLKCCHIVYIGQGRAGARIEKHFSSKLFDFMQSLSGAEYNIQIALPKRPNCGEYYRHVEFQMLSHFAEKFGGTERALPLLNKNRGSDQGYTEDNRWWSKAIDRVGKKPIWSLNPTAVPRSWELE